MTQKIQKGRPDDHESGAPDQVTRHWQAKTRLSDVLTSRSYSLCDQRHAGPLLSQLFDFSKASIMEIFPNPRSLVPNPHLDDDTDNDGNRKLYQ